MSNTEDKSQMENWISGGSSRSIRNYITNTQLWSKETDLDVH